MADEKDEINDEESEIELTFDVDEAERDGDRRENEPEPELLTSDEQPLGSSGGDAALREELRKVKDAYVRSLADLDNYRKRAERDRVEYRKFAISEVMRELLPVLDNFERALDHSDAADEFHTGIELIYKQLSDALQKMGLTSIGEVGAEFDPNVHEAIARDEESDLPHHTISAVLQKGYLLNERLLRPALVRVAMGGGENAS